MIDTQGLLKSALIAYARSRHSPRARFRERARAAVVFLRPHLFRAVDAARGASATARSPRRRWGTPCPWRRVRHCRAGSRHSRGCRTGRYTVLVHATSARAKLWPEERWIELGSAADRSTAAAACCRGATRRSGRAAERLARAIPEAVVPPGARRSAEVAAAAGGRCVRWSGVDTGLTHLAAALEVPTVGHLLCNRSRATGLYGCARAVNLGGASGPPTVEEVMAARAPPRVNGKRKTVNGNGLLAKNAGERAVVPFTVHCSLFTGG